VVHEFVGALAFPLALTTRPIAITWDSRLLSHLVVAIGAAVGAAAARRRESEAY
jgi:hypothetical protein